MKRKVAGLLNKLMYPHNKVHLGHNVEIRKNVYFDYPDRVFISDGCFVNYGASFHIGDRDKCCIELCENVFVGQNVAFICVSHEIGDDKKRAGNNIYKSIHVGKGVWIGASSTILQGVKIGSGSIIAAGSCVIKDIPENEMWGGTPAKFIKKLD